MSIQNYYNTISILQASKVNNGIGGKTLTWNIIDTVQGVINQDVGSETVNGKVLERTVYKGYTEVNSNIEAKHRLKDIDNKIYRIKGSPKNTIRKNHHYRLELDYYEEDQE